MASYPSVFRRRGVFQNRFFAREIGCGVHAAVRIDQQLAVSRHFEDHRVGERNALHQRRTNDVLEQVGRAHCALHQKIRFAVNYRLNRGFRACVRAAVARFNDVERLMIGAKRTEYRADSALVAKERRCTDMRVGCHDDGLEHVLVVCAGDRHAAVQPACAFTERLKGNRHAGYSFAGSPLSTRSAPSASARISSSPGMRMMGAIF